jgi:hypothetical protein
VDRDALQGFGNRFVKGRDDDAPPDQRANLPSGDLLPRAYCTQDIVHSDEAGRASKLIASRSAPVGGTTPDAYNFRRGHECFMRRDVGCKLDLGRKPRHQLSQRVVRDGKGSSLKF